MDDASGLLQEGPHIVVIGGGITGLSAVYHLEQLSQAEGLNLRCTLVERDTRLGGKLLTEHVEDSTGRYLVEGGPDSFVAQKPWASELAQALGIGSTIHGSQPVPQATAVLCNGRPRPLPDGTLLIVPTRFWPFATSPLISPLGKLRMALDLVIPARAEETDESLADFIRRRLGSEALDRLAEPLMSGIHSAECERQSLLATFPRFRDIERRHGSLIRGMVAGRAAAKPGSATTPFLTLQRGVGSLADAAIGQIRSPLLTGRSARSIAQTESGRYLLSLDDGTELLADAVVVTTPAFAAAELLGSLAPSLAEALRSIRYVSTATITLAYPETAITSDLAGYGVIIPRGERRRINACTISSRKFAGRAPAGQALVRVFVGGSRTPEALKLSDEALLGLAQSELRDILGVRVEPHFTRIYRWERGNPQYDVGHLDRIAAIERLQPDRIVLAGAAYRGVGIPDCVKQGRDAAIAALGRVSALGIVQNGQQTVAVG
jgi:oxygen-dependent protoporphyrinogen oxidase